MAEFTAEDEDGEHVLINGVSLTLGRILHIHCSFFDIINYLEPNMCFFHGIIF